MRVHKCLLRASVPANAQRGGCGMAGCVAMGRDVAADVRMRHGLALL